MNFDRACKFFYKKKLLKKQCIYRNKKLNILLFYYILCFLLFYDVIIQTNTFYIFADLLNFTTKCIRGQIKAFSFLFCTTSNAKSTKGGER